MRGKEALPACPAQPPRDPPKTPKALEWVPSYHHRRALCRPHTPSASRSFPATCYVYHTHLHRPRLCTVPLSLSLSSFTFPRAKTCCCWYSLINAQTYTFVTLSLEHSTRLFAAHSSRFNPHAPCLPTIPFSQAKKKLEEDPRYTLETESTSDCYSQESNDIQHALQRPVHSGGRGPRRPGHRRTRAPAIQTAPAACEARKDVCPTVVW